MKLRHIFMTALVWAGSNAQAQTWEHYKDYVDPNETGCHQDTMSKYAQGGTPAVDYQGNFWMFTRGNQVGNDKVKFCVKLPNCQSDTSMVYKFDCLRDKNGDFWKFSSRCCERVDTRTDSMVILKYDGGGVFKSVYRYDDIQNPIISIKVIDPNGNFWGIYGHNWQDIYNEDSTRILSSGFEHHRLIQHDGTKWIDHADLDDQVQDIILGKNNEVWVLSATKLMKYDGKAWTNETLPASLPIGRIAQDGVGNIWYGSGVGFSASDADSIYKFNGTWTKFFAPAQYEEIMGDNEEGVWTYEPLKGASYTKDGSTWLRYTMNQGLTDNYIYKIAIDPQGYKWFATGSGVSKLVADPRINVLGLSESQLNNETLLYPNPVVDQLHINGLMSETQVGVYTTKGQLVHSSTVDKDQSLKLSHLEKGIYLLKLQDQYNIRTSYFVKD